MEIPVNAFPKKQKELQNLAGRVHNSLSLGRGERI